MKKYSIISYIEKDFLTLLKQIDSTSYVMCADIGYQHAKDAGITPDIVIGDFDSYKGSTENVNTIVVPSEKDDTDTGLCVSYALEHGADDITVYGGMGGRIDHTIANIQLLSDACRKCSSVKMLSLDNQLHFIHNGSISLQKKDDSYLSVFSLSNISTGVSVYGAKYPLENATLTNAFPLGVSNEFVDEKVVVTVEKGTLLLAVSKK